MIDWLEIKQFAIAEHVELEFEKNFTTVTGETGSGKSLIVDAVGILLGDRSDNSFIRYNQDTAELQAAFALPPHHPALLWLDEHGMSNDDECILRRVIRRDRSSKGYINGRAVTVSQLRDIGKDLVDIHGQNEHYSLLKKSVQQNLLDSAAGNQELIRDLGDSYQTLANIQSQIAQLNDQSHSAQERADLLKFQIVELNELDPQTDEWASLENRHKSLNHQQELASGTQSIAEMLSLSENVNLNSQLIQCIQQLEQLSEFDAKLKPIAQMLGEAQVNIGEAASQLRRFFQDTEIDPEEIGKIEKRFSMYHSLARKHRMQPNGLLQHLAAMRQELDGLKDPEQELKRLNELFNAEMEKYQTVATRVSENRKKTAKRLAKEVTLLMQELGMSGGKFDIHLTSIDSDKFTRYGNENVEFIVTANPGNPLLPLSKVTSGGELSRISLGIQVILANKAQTPTLIFDEVDVGIGGEVANVVGQKLKELGKSSQVVCITHLSQVAAKGDHHFNVSKEGTKQVEARVVKLNNEQRINELARMTGGDNVTKESLAHAEKMLRSA